MRVPTVCLALGAAILAGGFDSSAEACSCVEQTFQSTRAAVAAEARASRAVFVARVVRDDRVRFDRGEWTWRVRMQIEEAFKGTPPEAVDLFIDDTSCGYRMTAGERYLVYAFDRGGNFETNLCTRTGPADGHRDLTYLRDGSYLRPIVRAEPKRGLLVAHEADPRLLLIDPGSGQTEASIDVSPGPHEMAISRDGGKLVITSYDPKPPSGSSLLIVDLATLETRRRLIGSLFRPQAIVISDDMAWYSIESQVALESTGLWAEGGRPISVPRTDRRRTPLLVTATRTGSLIWTYVKSEDVAFGGASGVTHVPVGGVPQLIELTPDDRHLWVVSGTRLTVVDVERKVVLTAPDLPIRRPSAMQFLPDGTRVVMSDLESGDVLVLDTQTYELRGRVQLGRGPADIAVTPNGRQAYIAMTGENAVVGLDLARMAIFQTIPTGEAPNRIVWSGPR
jgi:YVTN family beta-propeller protein